MYSNKYPNQTYKIPNNGDRFIGGGFLGPFILGGITGGLLAPNFYPRPVPVPVYPRPIYGPYYPGPGPIYYNNFY